MKKAVTFLDSCYYRTAISRSIHIYLYLTRVTFLKMVLPSTSFAVLLLCRHIFFCVLLLFCLAIRGKN